MPTTKALSISRCRCSFAYPRSKLARRRETISDRRYGPSETRGSPGQVIEIAAPYGYPGLRNLAIAWSSGSINLPSSRSSKRLLQRMDQNANQLIMTRDRRDGALDTE